MGELHLDFPSSQLLPHQKMGEEESHQKPGHDVGMCQSPIASVNTKMDGHKQQKCSYMGIGHWSSPKVVRLKVSHSVFTPQQFIIERDSTAISDT